jgi:hypothetical protein
MRCLLRSLQNLRLNVSRNPKIYILPSSFLGRVGRPLLAIILVLLLFVPVVVVGALPKLVARLVVTLLASSIFIIVLSMLTKARTVEVFMAGAT